MKGMLCGILPILLAGSAIATVRAAPAPREAKASAVNVTPVVASIDNLPIPVKGSDGLFHLVYEVNVVNVTGETASLNRLDVVDARSGRTLASLDAAQIAQRLSIASSRTSTAADLGPSQMGILYLHVLVHGAAALPAGLKHALTVTLKGQTLVETIAPAAVKPPTTLVLAPPLKGRRYVAGDGCCDSIRHVRATLPINGQLFDGQRFAIDWEQLDAQGCIRAGDNKTPESYVIYGQPVYAAANAVVVAAVDGMPNSPPGALPANIRADEADGNHVVLDLGHGNYALYAHLAPHSLKVKQGQRVREGQMLGRVGTSGNSSEPHLHFQVSNGPLPLASNGVPYVIREFSASQRVTSTAAFDKATEDGQPIAVQPLDGPSRHTAVLPLDLSIVDFTH
ncbi:M23 family metallopeptidase [Paraburkholderia sp. J12]|uniref:M23 family metallopeptidase n=1 Tax=Paraburkholderia sp. J12 TaxID=2805432 RepID=UPI002ABE070A|nr:M23 family metallopeptidase [Paraburkholderia sp. J12]